MLWLKAIMHFFSSEFEKSGVGCQVSGGRTQKLNPEHRHLEPETWRAWAKPPTIWIYTPWWGDGI